MYAHDDGYELRPLRKSEDAIVVVGGVGVDDDERQQQQQQQQPRNDGCCCRYHPRDRLDGGCTTATATMTMTTVGTARDLAATAASPGGGLSGLWAVLRPSAANLNTICSALSPVMIVATVVWMFATEHWPDSADSAAFARFARRVINCSLHVEATGESVR